jgi:aldose 1-epimerase
MASFNVDRGRRDGVEVVTLEGPKGAVAHVAPALGNNCFELAIGESVLERVEWEAFLAKPTSYGIPILFPFPNRIRDRRFEFRGRSYAVEPQQHGFVRQRPWSLVAAAADDGGAWVTSAFDAADYPEEILASYPWPFRLEATHRLDASSLALELAVTSDADAPMPIGYGIHPYFRLPARGTLRVPATRRWVLDAQLPTGDLVDVAGGYDLSAGADVRALELDDIYTSLEPSSGEVSCAIEDAETRTRTKVEFDAADFPNVVVYTPPAPREAICVEPMTCPTDAFNLEARGVDAHVVVLEPGERRTFRIRVAVEPLGTLTVEPAER